MAVPLISVIVPVYNVENYLARCVDSILNQTLTDFEVILVDDGRYYMHVDPGVLRSLLYGGIIFYFAILFYQFVLTFPQKKRKDYYIFVLIFIYFFLMDFKGGTMGMNKFAFSTTLLLGFSYTREKCKKEYIGAV